MEERRQATGGGARPLGPIRIGQGEGANKKLTKLGGGIVTAGELVKDICPRGNNNIVIYISLCHDKCLLFMLELY